MVLSMVQCTGQLSTATGKESSSLEATESEKTQCHIGWVSDRPGFQQAETPLRPRGCSRAGVDGSECKAHFPRCLSPFSVAIRE